MECLGVGELNYGEWSLGFHKRISGRRIPLEGSIELTFRCSNNCIHCYCNQPVDDPFEKAREMNTDTIARIISEAVDQGCLWLLLTGGEPLLRPDFKDIYLYAKKKGVLLTLFTNGTLINPGIADFLAEWRPFSIEITLYGATEKTYEAITRIPGSYRRCMNGIMLLLKRNLPLKLKTVAIRQNVYEIPVMKSYAEGLGLDFRFDPLINARIDGNKSSLSTRLAVEDVVRLDVEDEKRLKAWKEFCDKYAGHMDSDRLYSCGGGVNSFHIDPYGNLGICALARKDTYSLRFGSFKEGWYDFIARLRERSLSLDNQCRRCEFLSLCGQCPGWAQLEHGNDETSVGYLCEIAHKRAESLGVK